jgi:hypothetical protein
MVEDDMVTLDVSPREHVVKSPQKPLAKPTPIPILKAPTHTLQEDSIAARIKAR